MANTIVTQRDTQLERQRAGHIELSLTNFTTSAEPQIAAGSVVEISGSLYSFTGNQSITGWAGVSVGDAYIKLVPDGTNPCTAEFTATAPTWNDAKQGWYDGTGTDRYVAGLYKTSSTEYDNKFIYSDRSNQIVNNDNTFTGDNTFSGITNLVKNNTIGSPVYSTQSVTSTAYLIPQGTYFISVSSAVSGTLGSLEILAGGTWRNMGGGSVTFGISTLVISDGDNVRVRRSAGSGTVDLRLVKIY